MSLSMYEYVCLYFFVAPTRSGPKTRRARSWWAGVGEGGGRRGVERDTPKLSLGVCTRKLNQSLHLD